ncbi:hypothetical protein CHS0354_011261, partial [Potamilus streckersoni]
KKGIGSHSRIELGLFCHGRRLQSLFAIVKPDEIQHVEELDLSTHKIDDIKLDRDNITNICEHVFNVSKEAL